MPKVAEDKEKVLIKDENPKGEYTLEVLEDHTHVDPFYIPNKDADKQYRFINFKSDANYSMKTSNLLYHSGGWQVCPREHLLRLGIKEDQLAPDGSYRVGNESVLCFMPKALYEKKMAEKKKRNQAPMEAVERMLKKGDPNVGGKEIHPSMGGIQTKEKLKGNF